MNMKKLVSLLIVILVPVIVFILIYVNSPQYILRDIEYDLPAEVEPPKDINISSIVVNIPNLVNIEACTTSGVDAYTWTLALNDEKGFSLAIIGTIDINKIEPGGCGEMEFDSTGKYNLSEGTIYCYSVLGPYGLISSKCQ